VHRPQSPDRPITRFIVTPTQRDLLRTWWFSAALVPACVYFLVVDYGTPGLAGLPWFVVHSTNLLPHEAGHFFFRFFGEWMMYAGGSLMQLIFPGFFIAYCLTNGLRPWLQCSLGWLGQSFIDVSVYAADAQARSLPLIGGIGRENHDWWNMLIMTGTLHHTELIAGLLVAAGILVWVVMLAVPRWMV